MCVLTSRKNQSTPIRSHTEGNKWLWMCVYITCDTCVGTYINMNIFKYWRWRLIFAEGSSGTRTAAYTPETRSGFPQGRSACGADCRQRWLFVLCNTVEVGRGSGSKRGGPDRSSGWWPTRSGRKLTRRRRWRLTRGERVLRGPTVVYAVHGAGGRAWEPVYPAIHFPITRPVLFSIIWTADRDLSSWTSRSHRP